MKQPTLEQLLERVDGTWDEVAEELGVSARTLYNLRRGTVKPHRATLLAIAHYLEVTPAVVQKAIAAGG